MTTESSHSEPLRLSLSDSSPLTLDLENLTLVNDQLASPLRRIPNELFDMICTYLDSADERTFQSVCWRHRITFWKGIPHVIYPPRGENNSNSKVQPNDDWSLQSMTIDKGRSLEDLPPVTNVDTIYFTDGLINTICRRDGHSFGLPQDFIREWKKWCERNRFVASNAVLSISDLDQGSTQMMAALLSGTGVQHIVITNIHDASIGAFQSLPSWPPMGLSKIDIEMPTIRPGILSETLSNTQRAFLEAFYTAKVLSAIQLAVLGDYSSLRKDGIEKRISNVPKYDPTFPRPPWSKQPPTYQAVSSQDTEGKSLLLVAGPIPKKDELITSEQMAVGSNSGDGKSSSEPMTLRIQVDPNVTDAQRRAAHRRFLVRSNDLWS
ncbi:hypothetical protein BCR39DRAFT_585904 [Naematelia encephala]|uniref:F-box domain-containing protein n=1 Tax=Naematelia encephala TaxID=71784 RepID=A0A1Y2BJL6_9TREE|nr:hypothetical protein BCR39DRAFT_585904 [Naematelia encephala]